MWSRDKIGKTAQEIADHLMLAENVRALQQGQKDLASALSLLDGRLRTMEADFRAIKAEAKFEAIKETQQMLNAVQGAFNDKLTELTVRVAQAENHNNKGPMISLPNSILADGDTTPS